MGVGVWGLGFGVWGSGFGVWGLEFRVQGSGFRLWGGHFCNVQRALVLVLGHLGGCLGFRVWLRSDVYMISVQAEW